MGEHQGEMAMAGRIFIVMRDVKIKIMSGIDENQRVKILSCVQSWGTTIKIT